MVTELIVHKRSEMSFTSFLQDCDFDVEELTENVIKACRTNEMPVYIHIRDNSLYFEVDLGSLKGFSGQELFIDLLDINTEILPVSVGIDTTEPNDPRLVLLESREANNLDENELLSVMDALELAAEKVATVLQKYV